MEWLDRINGAMDYIEAHLASDIDYEEAARIVCCSSYHFQRMFSFITDVPLSEYIRRRRLTMAAFEIRNSAGKIIDIALKYGYDSPNSFTRAFQNLHGVTPSMARDPSAPLKAYPRMSFHVSVKGDTELNYRIEQRDAFRIFGVEKIIDTADDINFYEIPRFWDECRHNGTMDRLMSLEAKPAGNGLCRLNSAMCYRMTGETSFPYLIGIIDSDCTAEIPEDLTVVDIYRSTWAIFSTGEHNEQELSDKLQAVWKRVFPEWFPVSGYDHASGPELELTYEISPGRYYSEIWIPVIKR